MCMKEQVNDYFVDLLFEFQCGFRQGFNSQQCLLVLIEKPRKIRCQRGVFAAVVTFIENI